MDNYVEVSETIGYITIVDLFLKVNLKVKIYS